MKILQLCKKFPYPLKDGESIAITYLSKALHQLGAKVTLLAMNTSKHYFDMQKIPKDFNHYEGIHTARVDNQIKIWDAFLNLFSNESYHITRFISTDFEKKLIQLLQEEQFDIVQLETLYLAPYIPIIKKYSSAIVSMRGHNVEHEIWERIADHTGFFIKKWYLKHLTKKLKAFEIQQLDHYDILLAITQRDLELYQSLGYQSKALVTPIGIDSCGYVADNDSYQNKMTISFIGSLDWMPNLEGLQWFLDEIWAQLSARFPNVELHIAGRNTPDWMLQMNLKNIHIHGEVPDALDFINDHSLMIVPLLSGSGMRVKILEGMALGKVVLTTSMGLEGIDATDKKEVLIANQPEDFIEAVEYCYQNQDKLMDLGQRAQILVAQKYDNLEIARTVIRKYEELTGKRLKDGQRTTLKNNGRLTVNR